MNTKAASERYQRQVLELSKLPGNAACADCGGRYPRWASWSLGIFLCVNCAGVHRKMGTHISKVKSLTLDTWNKEQVEKMREIGNENSNAKYNPDVRRNRPPANVEEGERNSDLERFIFDKYRGRFMDSKPPPVPVKDRPSLSPNPTGGSSSYFSASPEQPARRRGPDALGLPSSAIDLTDRPPARSRTAPIPSSWAEAKRAASPQPPLPTGASTATKTNGNGAFVSSANVPPRSSSSAAMQQSRPVAPSIQLQPARQVAASGMPTGAAHEASPSVFDDLLSLQGPHPPEQQQQTALQMLQPNQQMNPWAHLAMQQQAVVSPMVMSHVTDQLSPYFTQQQQPQLSPHSPFGAAGFADNQQRSASLGSMAFSNGGYGGMAASVPSQPNSYFGGGQNASPSYLGTSPMAGQQQQAYSTNISGYGGVQQPSPQPQQQQQQFMQPQQAQQVAPSSNPFGSFATSMMPTGQQPFFQPQQQQQQQAQQQQANAWSNQQNMWG